ncbi:MAG: InlB B-repeat-containing protein [Clostridiales bacterium]|nr:InlB B-repeat-containing protein [Clostridiales bacterium]
MLKRTTRRILAWSVVFAMLFSLTAQPAAAADVSADASAPVYSAQADEDAAEETTEAEPAEEEAETDPADDSGEADEGAEESADASAGEDTGETEEEPADEPAEESAEEPADGSGEKATLTLGAAAAIAEEEDEEEEAETTVTASAYTEPSTDSNGVYQISTASELFWFAQKVNNGTTGANAVLTADIDLESATWTPIGGYDSRYTGSFDGQGYTVSGLYRYDLAYTYLGLFGYVASGGTVKNVTVSGSFSAYYYIGGVAGYNAGTISGCVNQVSVNSKHSGGGIVGGNSGTVTNCCNTGTVAGLDDSDNIVQSECDLGGIAGENGGTISNCWNSGTITGGTNAGPAHRATVAAGIASTSSGTVINCYNVGTISAGSSSTAILSGIALCYSYFYPEFYSLGPVTNCYYLSGTQSDSNATSMTADQFASGEVAYLLNGSTNGGTNWYQNLGTDSYPVLDSSHGIVYYGYTCTSTTAAYSNSQLYDTAGHTYDDNGFCTRCGNCEPATLSNGVYQIENAGNLFWFAALVNGDTSNAEIDARNSSANAVLTGDIDLNDDYWLMPIGYIANYPYNGTFDGCGYTISGLYIPGAYDFYVGLFGVIGTNGKVQNLTVDGTIDCSGGFQGLGSIAGYSSGTIANCISSCTISDAFGAEYVGGIVGYNTGTVTDCGYACNSMFYGGTKVGGVVGWNSSSGSIENCYSAGVVDEGGIAYWNDGAITNCYYFLNYSDLEAALDDLGTTTNTEGVTLAQFNSGEVAYLLNSNSTTGVTWYQNLDNGETVDSYPVLSSSHGTVYQCTGDTCTSVIYSNDADNNGAGAHDYDEDGFCTSCGAYEPAEQNSDGYYEITNAGNLFWFAALVNSTTTITVNGVEVTLEGLTGTYANTSNAILTCDIDLENREWTPIGAYNSFLTHYAGVFDGQGHTVSGLYVNSSSNGQGLFGRVREGGTVQNLIVSGSVTGGNYVGGLAGASGGTITNCASHCTVSGSSYVGGFVGYVSANTSVDANSVSNCYSTGTVSGSSYVGAFTSESSGTVTNCYYLDTAGSDDYATAKSADEFASGEVAWLLQNGQSAQVWGQTLTGDADAYPVLTDEESRLVVKVTIQDEDETVLSTSYINSGSKLDADVYPDAGAYAFYSDEACTKRIEDVVSQTYSADATVYVKSIVTATVYVDGAAETVSVVEGETYDLTALVPDGYLYGGTFTDEDFADVIEPDTCGNGAAFTPEDGETYYVKLVDDSYFQIKCLLAYQSYTPTNLWLVTNIDSDGYQSYGFDLLYADDETDSLVVTDEATKQLYQELEINGKTYTGTVDISDFTGFTDDDYDEDDLDRNLVGYYDLSEMVEEMIDADAVMFVPFFVTQDGVKVTGAVQRTISLASGATSVSGMYNCTDEGIASTASVADNDSGSVILLLSSSLRVSATAFVTNIEDETTTYTITKYDGDTVTTQAVEAGAASGTVEYAEKDGYLFAGWFTDEDYTTAADFSDVTGDMTVYAKYVSADYLQVKASTVSSKGVVKSIRMISATDSKNYAEVGFVYQYGNVESSVEVTKYSTSISGKTAKSLFGVVTGSKLIYADLSVSGMEANTAVTITPYWVTLDGTTVYGAERTITYTGSGIE